MARGVRFDGTGSSPPTETLSMLPGRVLSADESCRQDVARPHGDEPGGRVPSRQFLRLNLAPRNSAFPCQSSVLALQSLTGRDPSMHSPKPHKARRLVIVGLFCLLVYGGVIGVNRYFTGMALAAMASMSAPTASVSVAEVRSQTWPDQIDAVTTLEAPREPADRADLRHRYPCAVRIRPDGRAGTIAGTAERSCRWCSPAASAEYCSASSHSPMMRDFVKGLDIIELGY